MLMMKANKNVAGNAEEAREAYKNAAGNAEEARDRAAAEDGFRLAPEGDIDGGNSESR